MIDLSAAACSNSDVSLSCLREFRIIILCQNMSTALKRFSTKKIRVENEIACHACVPRGKCLNDDDPFLSELVTAIYVIQTRDTLKTEDALLFILFPFCSFSFVRCSSSPRIYLFSSFVS